MCVVRWLGLKCKKPAQRRALIDWSCDKRKYHIMEIKLVHFRQTVNNLLLT